MSPVGLKSGWPTALDVPVAHGRWSAAGSGENVFAAQVLRDRFFGATRQLEVAAGKGRLEIETSTRDHVAVVCVPREAIQFLSAH